MNGPVSQPPVQNPTRWPAMRRGLVTVRLDDGLLIEGAANRQFLTGTAASTILPRLLPLLDGRHSPEEICAALSLGAAHLDQVLRLLSSRALVEWVTPGAAARTASQQAATYLSRTIGFAGAHQSADDVADDLASAIVVIVAPPAVAGPIASDLSETGVINVTVLSAADMAKVPIGNPDHHIVAVFDDPANEHVLADVVTVCGERHLPLLRFAATAGTVEIGPFFYGPYTACIGCFRRGHRSGPDEHADSSLEGGIPAQPWTADDALIETMASLVTSALLAELMGQAPLISPRRLLRIAFPGPVRQAFDVIPDMECATCTGQTPPADAASREVLAYEWRVGMAPSRLAPAPILSASESQHLHELQRQRYGLPSSPCHQLPDQLDVPKPGATLPGHHLDESVLAAILVRIAGFRPATETASAEMSNPRWAPSGGNLGSVTIYLITDSDLFGLPGTIFRYDDVEHQIVSVHADRVTLAQILQGTDLDAARTDLVLVLAGAVGRLRKKYHDFAWRLAHLDAGCAALQLQLVAACYGLNATFASAWPAQLAEALELDTEHEVVTAVAGISAAGNTSEEGSSQCHLSPLGNCPNDSGRYCRYGSLRPQTQRPWVIRHGSRDRPSTPLVTVARSVRSAQARYPYRRCAQPLRRDVTRNRQPGLRGRTAPGSSRLSWRHSALTRCR